MSNEYKDWINDFTPEQRANMTLCHKYPILLSPEEADTTEYLSTQLDCIPAGWRKNFGEKMLQEIQSVATFAELGDGFYIVEMKERFGCLRVYMSQYDATVDEIISYYQNKSRHVCASCGKESEAFDLRFAIPCCIECATNILAKTSNLKENL